MNRREMMRALGGALAVPWLSALPVERVDAVGRAAHHRARRRALQVLDPHQSETVATIAEMILPATDTPGARAAQVHRFVDLLLAEWFPDDERTRFLAGLADVDARARSAFGADFIAGSDAQRAAILTQLDAEVEARRRAKQDPRQHFFQGMKWLTLYGYYTSELGANAELHFEAVPVTYDACTPLANVRAVPGDF